nr:luciferase family protein [Parazoarcus communis]
MVLSHERACGPPQAFMVGREFAHVHPADDGSMHLILPLELVSKGWGEPHPMAEAGYIPANAVMAYAPRDIAEIDILLGILRTSWDFACGHINLPSTIVIHE